MSQFIRYFLSAALLFAASASLAGESSPRPKQGILNVAAWDFVEQGNLELRGSWRYHSRLSEHPWEDWEKSEPIQIPDYGLIDVPAGTHQTGSYMLHVQRGQSSLRNMMLYVYHVMGSHRLRLCSLVTQSCQIMGGSGIVSEQIGTALWHGSETKVLIPDALLEEPSFLIVVDSSSYLRTKGFTSAPRLGSAPQIEKLLKRNALQEAFLLGAFGMIALHAGFMFFQSRRTKADLYVSLLALCFLGRYFITEWLEFDFIPANNTGYSLAYFSLFYFSTLALTTYTFLLHSLYGGTWLRRLSIASSIITGLHIASQSVFEASLFMSHVNTIFLIPHFVVLFLIVGSVWKLFRRREQDSGYVLFSVSILMLVQVNDYVSGILMNFDLYLFHYGVFCFAFSQSMITARRFDRTHRQNEKLLVEISEKEQARTLFFHNTSHELRTPLNGLIGFLTLLRDERYGKIGDQARLQVNKCLRLAESLKNQVNTILDLAKAKKGLLNLSHSVISLPSFVAEAKELAEGLVLKKSDSQFEVKVDWDPERPDFIGDKEKLAAILRNLLGNAFKFADPRRPNHVAMLVQKRDGQLRIRIQDTGIGIPEDQRSVIFEEFKQVAGDARRAYEGSGLGLSMVRDLVQLMQGRIELESKVDQGSIFTVTIPEQSKLQIAAIRTETLAPILSESTAQIALVGSNQVAISVPEKVFGSARILVVDDNEINCEVIQHMLEERGYTVESELSGRGALERLKVKSFDMVLLDMMMPEMSGEDVIRTLRADPMLREIPIILITARASDDDRIFGLSLGADDYLAKPLHAEELSFRVKNLLERLDLQRRSFALEEQERMAQLGELLSDLSHELKNVFQFSDAAGKLDSAALQHVVRKLPIKDQSWELAAASFVDQKQVESGSVAVKSLSFQDPTLAQDSTLRALRLRISYLDISMADRQMLWHRIQDLSFDDRLLCEQTLGLVRSFALMRDQTRFAQELIVNVLNFNKPSQNDYCSVKEAADSILSLTSPKLKKLKIKVEHELPDTAIAIDFMQIRQVMLNLLSNATITLQTLPMAERWIRMEARTEGLNLVFMMSNGGAKIPADLADQIFSRGTTGSLQQGHGLGLAISRRLIQRVGGSIHLDQSQGNPCFCLSIPLFRDKGKLSKAS